MLDEQPAGTAVENVAPPAPGGEGSAPSQTDASTPANGGAGSVETPEESKTNSGLPKWAYGHERQLREMKRTLAALNERLAQPDSRAAKTPDQNGATPNDVWTDPDAWAERKFQTLQEKAEVRQKKFEALKYLRSQEDVTPDNEDEIATVLEETGLIAMMDRNPKKAIEIALDEWRKARGITAPADRPDPKAQLAKDRARGFAGAAASGGSKVWSKAEIDAIAADPDQWQKHSKDIMAAIDAGRVRA